MQHANSKRPSHDAQAISVVDGGGMLAPFPEEVEQLAVCAVDLAKAAILSDNHFLASAVSRLHVQPARLDAAFATDGNILAFDCKRVLDSFKHDGGPCAHDLLHVIVHCLFLHPFVGDVEPRLWDLACDLAAERVVAEVLGPRPGTGGIAIMQIVEHVHRDLRERADAERLYRELRQGRWADKSDRWAALLKSDSHELWYGNADSPCDYTGNAAAGRAEGEFGGLGNHGQSAREESEDGKSDDRQAGTGKPDGTLRGGQAHLGGSAESRQTSPAESSGATSQGAVLSSIAQTLSSGAAENRSRGRQQWRDEAISLAVNLQTMAAGRGSRLIEFVADLRGSVREADDYAGFLASFAALGEAMRLSDEEFDFGFYTFGMRLYGDMPLIEPLEYCEERRIRTFVIVIDTSLSVQGPAVRDFVRTTFTLLKSSEAFSDKVCIHVIQCDERVLSDDVIEDIAELDSWAAAFTVRGGGGTDFRPAFDYVDQLIESGALHDVDGLLYFTDGLGVYPDGMPAYKTAFIFYDEGLVGDDVPVWAYRVVMNEDALARARWAVQ